jgi:hypothetical protein
VWISIRLQNDSWLGPLTMTDKFDAIEREVGIRVYLSDEPGFAGVVKARFSDFIVHEGKEQIAEMLVTHHSHTLQKPYMMNL